MKLFFAVGDGPTDIIDRFFKGAIQICVHMKRWVMPYFGDDLRGQMERQC